VRTVNGLGSKADAFQVPWGAPLDLDACTEKLASGNYKLVTILPVHH